MAQLRKMIKIGPLSLFGKTLMLIAFVTAVVAGLETWNGQQQVHKVAELGLSDLAQDATQATAELMAPALKFRKNDLVAKALTELAARQGGRLTGGFAFDMTLDAIATQGSLAPEVAEQLTSLANDVLKTGKMARDETGLLVALPSISAPSGAMLGGVALVWSADGIKAQVAGQMAQAMAVSFAVFAVLLSLAALYLRRALKQPLAQISAAMDHVAQGDFHHQTGMTGRRDEIGHLAQSLEVMRLSLVEGAEARSIRDVTAAEQKQVVEALSDGLESLAKGNLATGLTQDLPPAYAQLQRHFEGALENLNTAIGSVVSAAQRIDANAETIRAQADSLSQRTENQAATLEQTAAALEELTNHVQIAAASTKNIDNLVQKAQGEAKETGAIVADAVGAMQAIAKYSQQISTIISVIDDIAFQTNLLALNAGVEAARAGDSGRGFAVVASEVGALALRSSDAAKEIKSLINSSAEQVDAGVTLVGKAGNALGGIAARVQEISSVMGSIAEGAAMQSSGLNEINIGVRQLDQVTQRNSSMVLDTSNSVESMGAEIQQLIALVQMFQLSGESGGASSNSALALAS